MFASFSERCENLRSLSSPLVVKSRDPTPWRRHDLKTQREQHNDNHRNRSKSNIGLYEGAIEEKNQKKKK